MGVGSLGSVEENTGHIKDDFSLSSCRTQPPVAKGLCYCSLYLTLLASWFLYPQYILTKLLKGTMPNANFLLKNITVYLILLN